MYMCYYLSTKIIIITIVIIFFRIFGECKGVIFSMVN